MSAAAAVSRVIAAKAGTTWHEPPPGMAALVTLDEVRELLAGVTYYPRVGVGDGEPYEPALGDVGTLLGWPIVIVAALP